MQKVTSWKGCGNVAGNLQKKCCLILNVFIIVGVATFTIKRFLRLFQILVAVFFALLPLSFHRLKGKLVASTLTDIGQIVGCSTSTVSRVLNNSGPVSDKVRLRVESALREHGYVQRPSVRSTKTQRLDISNALILVYRPKDIVQPLAEDEAKLRDESSAKGFRPRVPTANHQLTNGFFDVVLDGLLKECSHWKVISRVESTSHLDAEILEQEACGETPTSILLVGPYRPEVATLASQYNGLMILVGINHQSRHDAITIDNYGGTKQAVEHLAELGHRDIGFVGTNGLPDFDERRHAFETNLRELGLRVNKRWINLGSLQTEQVIQRMSEMLSGSQLPTALVCGNDLTAMATIQAAHRCGIRVPEDLSVIGFDDIPVATLTSPPLTTVHVPMQQIGRQAVRQMVIGDSCNDSSERHGCVTRVATTLVVRNSTAPPRSEDS